MNYEKAYKEALEKIRAIYDNMTLSARIEDAKLADKFEEIFPELAESEDELTWLTRFIKEEAYSLSMDIRDNEDRMKLKKLQKSLDWLEKQGEQKYTQRDIDDVYLKGITDTKHEVEKESEEDKKIRADIAKFIFKSQEDIKDRSKWIEYLGYTPTFVGEKSKIQVELKTPNIEEMKFKIGDAASVYCNPLDHENTTITQKDFTPEDKCAGCNNVKGCVDCVEGDQWAKITEKNIKPKFNVGDFIVNDYCMGRVVEITNDAYLLDTEQGIPFSCEHNAHFWSIQDAKNGDILFAKGSYFKEYAFIYSGMTEDNVLSIYCGFDIARNNFDTKLTRFGRVEDFETVCPATKKQCETLFKAMHKAGYQWDADKKELKKISQRMASAEAKEAMYDKPTWSEEDEKMLECCTFGATKETQDWLKSLKDRIKGG